MYVERRQRRLISRAHQWVGERWIGTNSLPSMCREIASVDFVVYTISRECFLVKPFHAVGASLGAVGYVCFPPKHTAETREVRSPTAPFSPATLARYGTTRNATVHPT